MKKENVTYSTKPWSTKGIEFFLKARGKFEKTIDNAIDAYFKNKPKIIKVFTFLYNPNHYCILTADKRLHDVQITFQDSKYNIEIKEVLEPIGGR